MAPVQITITCADSRCPRTVQIPQPPVQIPDVLEPPVQIPDVLEPVPIPDVPQPTVQIPDVLEPVQFQCHKSQSHLCRFSQTLNILHVSRTCADSPRLDILDPFESTDAFDQLMSFVFGPKNSSCFTRYPLIFDENLFSFLDEREPMDLTMPQNKLLCHKYQI
ncbi:hypothetical protein TNCV_2547451 [Trichonephila clavipes]|nr:hypothetical protein TNCV_2547451 [Trichonephila clavipes]